MRARWRCAPANAAAFVVLEEQSRGDVLLMVPFQDTVFGDGFKQVRHSEATIGSGASRVLAAGSNLGGRMPGHAAHHRAVNLSAVETSMAALQRRQEGFDQVIHPA